MVNKSSVTVPRSLGAVVSLYVVNVVAVVVVLVVLSAAAPQLATDDAWIHSVIVLLLAGLLVLRWRAARRGRRSGLRAVGIICSVLFVANLVLAVTPDFMPGWLRADMVLVAALMAIAVGLVVRAALDDD